MKASRFLFLFCLTFLFVASAIALPARNARTSDEYDDDDDVAAKAETARQIDEAAQKDGDSDQVIDNDAEAKESEEIGDVVNSEDGDDDDGDEENDDEAFEESSDDEEDAVDDEDDDSQDGDDDDDDDSEEAALEELYGDLSVADDSDLLSDESVEDDGDEDDSNNENIRWDRTEGDGHGHGRGGRKPVFKGHWGGHRYDEYRR